MTKISFKKVEADKLFLNTLKQRVNQYFKENKIKKTGNAFSIGKALLLLMLYLIAFIGVFYSATLFSLYICYALMGVLTIFVALNIAHDAAHSTFSSKKWLNKIFLYTFDFLGASGYLWKLKHIYSHHPHVNIPNMDADIKQSNLVRIFPNAPFLKLHRIQYLYMPMLYAFYTLIWLCFRDFKDLFYTTISGKPNHKHPTKEYLKLFLGKFIFLGRMIFLPYVLLPFSLPQILFGFLIFNICASYTVALALISAHVGEHSVYPSPGKNGEMQQSWVRHQIVTTTDFATNSKLITHLFGGFNHHIVHHVFPNICHIHYPQLTPILIETCREFDMPYQYNATLTDAVLSHFNFLKLRSHQSLPVDYLDEI